MECEEQQVSSGLRDFLKMYFRIEIGGLTEKPTFCFIFTPWNCIEFFMKLKSFGWVQSLPSDNIQENTVEKDFQILIRLYFINLYTNIRGKDWAELL